MSARKVTVIYSGEVKCPECHKEFDMQIERETITPGTRAETEIRVRLSPGTQDHLTDDGASM